MAEENQTQQKEETVLDRSNILLFNRWSSDVEIRDRGLHGYINLEPVILPKSYGRHYGKAIHKNKMHIVERLANHMYVPGHRGKVHRITSGHCAGKYENVMSIVKEALEIIENKLDKNPIEVLVRAIENAALREEVTSYQLGGIIARKAVIASPQRRVDLVLRYIAQGSFRKSHKSKRSAAQALANELVAAYNNDAQSSNAISEKERIEREAAGAR